MGLLGNQKKNLNFQIPENFDCDKVHHFSYWSPEHPQMTCDILQQYFSSHFSNSCKFEALTIENAKIKSIEISKHVLLNL